MKIAVFLHGTITMHKDESSLHDFASYIPVGDSVAKLQKWTDQGAGILYLSSNEEVSEIEKDKGVLKRFNFPEGEIIYRQNGESYAQMVEKIMPDVLIEDDWESIGGEVEMCYPQIKPKLKSKIKEIVVKEFEGLDHLPDDLQELANY